MRVFPSIIVTILNFGLSGPTRTIHFGNEAKTFTEHVLLKPFTVHTAFASALGRSTKGRVYGFIITADGNDLASLLIKNGLARTHGKVSVILIIDGLFFTVFEGKYQFTSDLD